MKQLPLTLGLLSFCLAASPLTAQEGNDLQEKYDAKVSEDWVAQGGWILDYDKALAQAKNEGKYVFAYFSRSYSP